MRALILVVIVVIGYGWAYFKALDAAHRVASKIAVATQYHAN